MWLEWRLQAGTHGILSPATPPQSLPDQVCKHNTWEAFFPLTVAQSNAGCFFHNFFVHVDAAQQIAGWDTWYPQPNCITRTYVKSSMLEQYLGCSFPLSASQSNAVRFFHKVFVHVAGVETAGWDTWYPQPSYITPICARSSILEQYLGCSFLCLLLRAMLSGSFIRYLSMWLEWRLQAGTHGILSPTASPELMSNQVC